jgi:ankyrin repeat protein
MGKTNAKPEAPVGSLGEKLLSACLEAREADALAMLVHGAGVETRAPDGARLDHRKVGDFTPLMLASMLGLEDLACALLARGADPSAEATSFKISALPLAIKSPKIVEMLLSAGADPNRCDRMGVSPLMAAAGLAMGRAPGTRLGFSPEERALREMPDCAGTMRLLLAAGAKTDCRDFFGHSAASRCVHNDDPTRLGILLAAGVVADEAVGGVAQGSAIGLMEIAAKVGAPKCARVLMEAGVDPRVENERGESAVFWALASEWSDCAKLFGDRGWGMRDDAFKALAKGRLPGRKIEEALARAAMLEERRAIVQSSEQCSSIRYKRAAL